MSTPRGLCLALLLAAGSWWLTADAAVDCKHDNNNFCRCEFASSVTKSNLTLDLNHIGLKYPASVDSSDGKYEFTYNPCKPAVCPKTTGEASVACQEVISQEHWLSLGRYTNFKWEVTNDDPASLNFTITYGGGDEDRITKVVFTKASGTTEFSFVEEHPSKTYHFTVTGSGVTTYKPSSSSSSSGGTIAGPIGLAIIFLALGAVVAYCIVGGIYMYTQKGARGMEVVPNYAFWKDIPFLIKDGVLFIISPCYKNQNTYRQL